MVEVKMSELKEEAKAPETPNLDKLRKDVGDWAVVKLVYLLYKANMLSRGNLRQVLREANKPAPDNIVEYLLAEIAKA